MPIRKLARGDLEANLARTTEKLGTTLRLCTRDDAEVLETFYETRAVDEVHALDKATFFDEFFTFLRELGVWRHLEALEPERGWAPLIAWPAIIGVYIMRILLGIPSMPQTDGLILTDPALMNLFGLAAFVETGITQRGVSRAKSLPDQRGAFSGDAMADVVVRIALVGMAKVFNAVIALLAQEGFFPKEVHAVVDTTDAEATPTYETLEGSAVESVTRKKRPQHANNRHAPKTHTTIWGWKVWLMWCPQSGIPVALVVDRINVDDREWMVALVVQGQANLGGRLASVSFDRGFLDGVDLYRVGELLPFYIPGRKDMEVTCYARRLGHRVGMSYRKGMPSPEGIVATKRLRFVSGRGKNRKEEWKELLLVGISAIPFDTYAPEEVGSRIHSKKFRPNEINAVVVVADPRYPKEKPEEALVILTNMPLGAAAQVLSAYEHFLSRSRIENSGNKEAKQPWKLEAPLKRSEAALILHVHLVFLLMGLLSAFRTRKEREEKKEAKGERTGMASYRRELAMANRDKLLIRIGDRYGVFRTWEIMVLLGVQVGLHAEHTPESILARYGIDPKQIRRRTHRERAT
jgi:hypothetical protein